MIFKHANVFIDGHFQLLDVATKDDRIIEIADSIHSDDYIDCTGKYLIPGFIDIHTHGCVGHDFTNSTEEELIAMCKYYASKGVTSVLATVMTEKYSVLQQSMLNIKSVMKTDYSGCSILGINMEGPFLGADKKGAHDEKYLRPIDEDMFNELNELSGNCIRLVDIDPKKEGALDFIHTHSKTKTISLAHTSCNYELACEAFNAGASHITHLFNAMNGLHHRDPGIVGAMSDFNVHAELITDGIHIHPAVVRMMFKLDPQKMIIISDSMSASGLEDGLYSLGGQDVYVKNKKATLIDGTIAGSTTNVHDALLNCIKFGVKKEDAILSATKIPAKSIKADDEVGEISIGKKANLLITDEELAIERVFVNGKEYISE